MAALAMPDLVGMQLDEAYSELAEEGFADEDAVTIEGGSTDGVLIESDWTVCQQVPAPGESVLGEPTLAVALSCIGDEESEQTPTPTPETPTPTEPATPTTSTAPVKKPKKITANALFDRLNMNRTKLGDQFTFVGELTGKQFWEVGATGEYFVWVSVHGNTNEFEVFIDRNLTRGWGNGTRVKFVVEDAEFSIQGETSDGWMKAISAEVQ